MKKSRFRFLWPILTGFVLLTGEVAFHLDGNWQQSDNVASVSEPALWQALDSFTLPRYPDSSLRQQIGGVAVARVELLSDGQVTGVEILQSPDRPTEVEIKRAVQAWRFKAKELIGPTSPVSIVGKLTFYFTPIGPEGSVQTSAQLTRKPQ